MRRFQGSDILCNHYWTSASQSLVVQPHKGTRVVLLSVDVLEVIEKFIRDLVRILLKRDGPPRAPSNSTLLSETKNLNANWISSICGNCDSYAGIYSAIQGGISTDIRKTSMPAILLFLVW